MAAMAVVVSIAAMAATAAMAAMAATPGTIKLTTFSSGQLSYQLRPGQLS